MHLRLEDHCATELTELPVTEDGRVAWVVLTVPVGHSVLRLKEALSILLLNLLDFILGQGFKATSLHCLRRHFLCAVARRKPRSPSESFLASVLEDCAQESKPLFFLLGAVLPQPEHGSTQVLGFQNVPQGLVVVGVT